jgi:carboxylate-amine ligase
VARSLGYEFAMLGTHPFQRATQHTVFPDSRFEDARSRLAWMIYYRVAFGLHIHVGVGNSDQAMGIMNRSVAYLPHLLALSANSPYWQGVDTGMASCRAALYQLVPHSGIPPALSRWKDFRTYFQVMCDCGAASGLKDIKWDVRPRPDLGTLEFRICDMPDSLPRVFSIAAFVRSLTLGLARLLESSPRARRADSRQQWITVENRWLATRYGLEAVYIRSPAGKRRPLLDDLRETIEKLLPYARESGDEDFLLRLRSAEHLESGAKRQRQTYRETGDWTAMMQSLISRFNQELDAIAPKAHVASPVAQPT